MVVIDPGPDEDGHIRALSSALVGATEIRILPTHRHGDHAGAALPLAQVTGGALLASASLEVPEAWGGSVERLKEGDRVPTDEGDLVAFEVPGHTRCHLALHWIEADALFVGDLLLGKGDTTWVGEYPGCVEDYLNSLRKVQDLGVTVIYPGHGPAIRPPAPALERFRRHRLERLEEVREVSRDHPDADPTQLASLVYGGEIPEKLMKAAVSSVEAALFHLAGGGR